jgi:hypothetical protein
VNLKLVLPEMILLHPHSHEQDQEDEQDEDQGHDQEESIDQWGDEDDGDHEGLRTRPPHPRV